LEAFFLSGDGKPLRAVYGDADLSGHQESAAGIWGRGLIHGETCSIYQMVLACNAKVYDAEVWAPNFSAKCGT
jgi:hypothetical protein